jgi:TrmH RNA methyltransferase
MPQRHDTKYQIYCILEDMRNKLTNELAVCGMNAVLAVAEHHPLSINRLFLREDRLKSFTGICKQLAERKRPYKICEDEELERICKTVHHQGVVAMLEEPVVESLSMEDLELWANEGKTGLVLYSIGNEHNFGAIARAAAFFDVSFIVLNEKDTSFANPTIEVNAEGNIEEKIEEKVRLTTAAYRIAAGGLEHLTVRKVSNTAAFLKDASRQLVTIGTDTRARMRVSDLGDIIKASKVKSPGSRPGIALVFGNEETGLPQNIKEQCSALLRIPGTGNIDSLNVSQAATVFLHAIFEL